MEQIQSSAENSESLVVSMAGVRTGIELPLLLISSISGIREYILLKITNFILPLMFQDGYTKHTLTMLMSEMLDVVIEAVVIAYNIMPPHIESVQPTYGALSSHLWNESMVLREKMEKLHRRPQSGCLDLPKEVVQELESDIVTFPKYHRLFKAFEKLGITIPQWNLLSKIRRPRDSEAHQLPEPMDFVYFANQYIDTLPRRKGPKGSGRIALLNFARIATEHRGGFEDDFEDEME
ncbi:hypothetical protein TWF281_007829 [Arthrobotrys megalospora]